MLWSMRGIRPDERVGSAVMCEKLGISGLGDKMSQKHLRWYGHVARSNDWINQCRKIKVEGSSRRGRYNIWNGIVRAELRMRNLSEADVFDRKIFPDNALLQDGRQLNKRVAIKREIIIYKIEEIIKNEIALQVEN